MFVIKRKQHLIKQNSSYIFRSFFSYNTNYKHGNTKNYHHVINNNNNNNTYLLKYYDCSDNIKLHQHNSNKNNNNKTGTTLIKFFSTSTTIPTNKSDLFLEPSVIPQDVLNNMDPATAYAAGFHYFELDVKNKKNNNVSGDNNNSNNEENIDDEELSPELLKERGKKVMKEIRKQIKAQRRKLMLIDQQGKEGGGDIKQAGEISNLDIAKSLFRYAASKNHYDACVQLGNMHLQNENEINEAIEMYEIAGLKGNHPDGLYNLGNIYYEKQDYEKAVSYFEKASNVGDPSATFWLGYAYHRGIEAVSNEGNNDTANMVVDMDPKKAFDLLNKAANDGHNGARIYLAQAYRSSDEMLQIEKNDEKMWEYLNIAIDENDGEALYIVGDMYFNGSDGKEIDYRRALEYYLKSGYDGDHSVALCCAGSMYYNGLGVPRDFMAAFNLYQKSIEVDRNNLDAWKNIASMHYFGDGVQEDKEMAKHIHDVIIKNLEEDD